MKLGVRVAVVGVIFTVILSTTVTIQLQSNKRIESLRREAWRDADLSTRAANESRGEWVARAAGCIGCHTDSENDGEMLAGGVGFDTPIGRIISPNITSDHRYGIGNWTREQLADALINGRAPNGSHYWPALPYTAYRSMKTQDVVDLHAWLMASKPIALPDDEHNLWIPDAARHLVGLWKVLYVPAEPLPDVSMPMGQYLVQILGHCAECHAQRGIMGGIANRSLAGNTRGPKGASIPAITKTALRDWLIEDIAFYLEIGMTPEGDFAGAHMAPVIEHSTSHLAPDEREAIAEYLLSDINQ